MALCLTIPTIRQAFAFRFIDEVNNCQAQGPTPGPTEGQGQGQGQGQDMVWSWSGQVRL